MAETFLTLPFNINLTGFIPDFLAAIVSGETRIGGAMALN